MHKRFAALEEEAKALRSENSAYARRQADLVMRLREAHAATDGQHQHQQHGSGNSHSSPSPHRPLPPSSRSASMPTHPARTAADTAGTTMARPSPPRRCSRRSTDGISTAQHAMRPQSPASPSRHQVSASTPSAPTHTGADVTTNIKSEASPPPPPPPPPLSSLQRSPRQSSLSRLRRFAPKPAPPAPAHTTGDPAHRIAGDREYIERETQRLRIASASVSEHRRGRLGAAVRPVVPPIAPSSPQHSSSSSGGGGGGGGRDGHSTPMAAPSRAFAEQQHHQPQPQIRRDCDQHPPRQSPSHPRISRATAAAEGHTRRLPHPPSPPVSRS